MPLPTRLVERFSKVARYLQDRLGVPVKHPPVKSCPFAIGSIHPDHAA